MTLNKYALTTLATLSLWSSAWASDVCDGLEVDVTGTEGRDVLFGTPGRDVIAGLGGDDIIFGFGGGDVICGGDGADLIFAGSGPDQVDGGDGPDLVFGNRGSDRLFGGLDDDYLFGGVGRDHCDGYVGIDRALGCRSKTNVGLTVKRVSIEVPGGFIPVGGALAGQTISHLDGALFVPRRSKRVALITTHGTFGSFASSLTGWIGWWMEQNRITVLALNRRDSVDYGENEGGGGTLYEDTLCDVGLAVDYLTRLGYDQVIVQGFSKGTTVAPVYPVYAGNCSGSAAQAEPNDPRVAGVVTIGTIRDTRESGLYAPFGPACFDPNNVTARDLVARGFSGVLFPPGGFPNPPFPPIPVFGPQFCAQPPGVPFPFPFVSTPDSYLSYNGNPLRNTNQTAKQLVSPYLIIHSEGDNTTPRIWSDMLFSELEANGNDVSYFRQPYASLGYDLGGPAGGNAHAIANRAARDEATRVIGTWAKANIPGANRPARRLDYAAIAALPNFDPPLKPTPAQ